MTPSKYQEAVYDFVLNGQGNAIIEAVAGSGKTTTIKEAIKLIPQSARVVYLVFNKKNQLEAAEKLPPHVDVFTLNAFGNRICSKMFGGKVDARKVWNIADDCGVKRQHMAAVVKIVSLLRAHLGQLSVEAICEKYDIEFPKDAPVDAVYNQCVKMVGIRDFDDQLFLPVQYNLPFPSYDYVFVDECQDLNPVKIEMVMRLQPARIICVGDSRQAIYGFAGADIAAMQTLRERLHGTQLNLSVCYRCSKAVVEEAKKIVPEIEAWDQSPQGSVGQGKIDDVIPGDFILCRLTAPLVKQCLAYVRSGVKAIVLGREILDNLFKMIDDANNDFEILTRNYQRQLDALVKMNRPTDALSDRYETICTVFEECGNLAEVKTKLNKIFSDDVQGITLMTMHKSKGLEAQNVYILPSKTRNDLQPWQQEQERNLWYVATTRARMNLRYL